MSGHVNSDKLLTQTSITEVHDNVQHISLCNTFTNTKQHIQEKSLRFVLHHMLKNLMRIQTKFAGTADSELKNEIMPDF